MRSILRRSLLSETNPSTLILSKQGHVTIKNWIRTKVECSVTFEKDVFKKYCSFMFYICQVRKSRFFNFNIT